MALSGAKALIRKAFGFPEARDAFGLVVLNKSGMAVTPENAINVPAVSCAISKISETVGDLPAKLFARDDRRAAKQHPIYKLIHDEANEFTSAAQLRATLTRDALLHGKGFAHVVRSFDGRPLELQRIDPSIVRCDFDDDGTPFYVVNAGRQNIRLEYTDVLHIQPPGGISPIDAGREAIGLAMAFEAHIARLFANGARPSGIITATKSLDAEAKKKLSAGWFSTHSGSNSGGTAILDEGMQYQQIAMTLTDAQFAENRLEQIREIARVFNVPPTMLFELTRGTWSNTEEMARQFYQITLKPWLTAWTWAYARVLLTPEERARYYIEFVTDDLLTTDFSKKATALGQYRSMGAMTANEVRALLNLQPHPEGDSLSNPHITTPTDQPADPAQDEPV
ncbi:phage portal protein [Gellertiella hungarica]|uniref:HK97 family phage portal protein n=1 Tax=Gellertiella hungarica TaxID=1572859 RepID=A0A7W6JB44_9HYPH|nr:phage portal protein [Gellertiella hungarica]MBB4067176.1 HK97 family phage portal protein [Gellertiella hungarica]